MSNQALPKKRKDQAKRDTIIGIVFLTIVIIGIIIALIYSSGVFSNIPSGDRKINMDTGEEVEGLADLNPDITENANISYPGYEKFTFKAGKKKQDVYIHNPKENTCYIQISIILEDGTVIWKSEYLEPGNAFNRIKLNEALSKGNYENAVLLYDSYSIKDGRKLNGASIKMTLEVQ